LSCAIDIETMFEASMSSEPGIVADCIVAALSIGKRSMSRPYFLNKAKLDRVVADGVEVAPDRRELHGAGRLRGKPADPRDGRTGCGQDDAIARSLVSNGRPRSGARSQVNLSIGRLRVVCVHTRLLVRG
jgi:hypothetical protein